MTELRKLLLIFRTTYNQREQLCCSHGYYNILPDLSTWFLTELKVFYRALRVWWCEGYILSIPGEMFHIVHQCARSNRPQRKTSTSVQWVDPRAMLRCCDASRDISVYRNRLVLCTLVLAKNRFQSGKTAHIIGGPDLIRNYRSSYQLCSETMCSHPFLRNPPIPSKVHDKLFFQQSESIRVYIGPATEYFIVNES
jgi:hypothetical protein